MCSNLHKQMFIYFLLLSDNSNDQTVVECPGRSTHYVDRLYNMPGWKFWHTYHCYSSESHEWSCVRSVYGIFCVSVFSISFKPRHIFPCKFLMQHSCHCNPVVNNQNGSLKAGCFIKEINFELNFAAHLLLSCGTELGKHCFCYLSFFSFFNYIFLVPTSGEDNEVDSSAEVKNEEGKVNFCHR